MSLETILSKHVFIDKDLQAMIYEKHGIIYTEFSMIKVHSQGYRAMLTTQSLPPSSSRNSMIEGVLLS